MAQDSSRVVAAVEDTWAAVRKRHPDVPEVFVALGAGSGGRGGGLQFGRFAHSRWVRAGESVHELFVGGEGLERGAAATLGTLLHEAAHGVAATRGVQDTSRQGRWHNRKFKTIAEEELGIRLEWSDSRGWSTTTVPAATVQTYQVHVDALTAALTTYRRAEAVGGGRTSNDNGLAPVCPCGRKIRCSRSVYEAAPITCGACGGVFEAHDASASRKHPLAIGAQN